MAMKKNSSETVVCMLAISVVSCRGKREMCVSNLRIAWAFIEGKPRSTVPRRDTNGFAICEHEDPCESNSSKTIVLLCFEKKDIVVFSFDKGAAGAELVNISVDLMWLPTIQSIVLSDSFVSHTPTCDTLKSD